uniref:Uncharacterized protein n=1 Tax=Glossina pallidipes TaxID=7398 RepID=A0A1B0A383_GLOPL
MSSSSDFQNEINWMLVYSVLAKYRPIMLRDRKLPQSIFVMECKGAPRSELFMLVMGFDKYFLAKSNMIPIKINITIITSSSSSTAAAAAAAAVAAAVTTTATTTVAAKQSQRRCL